MRIKKEYKDRAMDAIVSAIESLSEDICTSTDIGANIRRAHTIDDLVVSIKQLCKL